MKYIILKSKTFGEIKINLTEAIESKKVVLNEAFNGEAISEIKRIINKEVTKKIEDSIKKELNSRVTEDKIVLIVRNCLVQFVKALWTKRGSWKSAIKNDSN